MRDYKEVWDDAYYTALEDGKGKEESAKRAYEAVQEWTDSQMAKAEAMDDR